MRIQFTLNGEPVSAEPLAKQAQAEGGPGQITITGSGGAPHEKVDIVITRQSDSTVVFNKMLTLDNNGNGVVTVSEYDGHPLTAGTYKVAITAHAPGGDYFYEFLETVT